jgi:hypothetical protein
LKTRQAFELEAYMDSPTPLNRKDDEEANFQKFVATDNITATAVKRHPQKWSECVRKITDTRRHRLVIRTARTFARFAITNR